LAPVTALFLIFAVVTAFLLSCFVPTLFFGSFAAAYAPPPRRMKRQSVDTTFE
jgi:hypothetical protein